MMTKCPTHSRLAMLIRISRTSQDTLKKQKQVLLVWCKAVVAVRAAVNRRGPRRACLKKKTSRRYVIRCPLVSSDLHPAVHAFHALCSHPSSVHSRLLFPPADNHPQLLRFQVATRRSQVHSFVKRPITADDGVGPDWLSCCTRVAFFRFGASNEMIPGRPPYPWTW